MNFVKSRLGMMMFLQYAVWGIWLPVLATYLQSTTADGGLGFTSGQVGWILGVAGSIGAVSAPFIAGQFADRYFSTEKFLAVLLVLGGIVKLTLSYQDSFTAWLILATLYSVLYMPTLSLTNSMAFAHLDDPDNEWPRIRVLGTIGWIAASWLFPMIWLQTDLEFQILPPFFVGTEVPDATARLADTLKVSGVLAILYAGFCLLLPHTPPKKEALQKTGLAIQRLTLEDRGEWVLQLKNQIVVKLGKEDIFERMQRFIKVYEAVGLDDKVGAIAEIDTRYPNGVAVSWKDDTCTDGCYEFAGNDNLKRKQTL